MAVDAYPRLLGPLPRGTAAWKLLEAARPTSERTNSNDQAVRDQGHPPKWRGRQDVRFWGAIRTVAQLWRRA
jgi:hypothetical protein